MLKKEKGFTLIELALVIVIIGIVIVAVLKGRDLMESARMKRFENDVRHWRTSAWLFLDRKGRFPGDGDDNGIIGDEESPMPGSTIIKGEHFMNPPKDNPLVIGGLRFWIYWGNSGGSIDDRKNVMVICASDDCEQTYTDNSGIGDLRYVEFLDAVVDGMTDGEDGDIRAVSITPEMVPVLGDDRAITSVGPGTPWTSGSTRVLVYYIDKRI